MGVKLEKETQITLDAGDLLAIITDNLCSYNMLAGLEASFISQNDGGDFEVTLSPKPQGDEG